MNGGNFTGRYIADIINEDSEEIQFTNEVDTIDDAETSIKCLTIRQDGDLIVVFINYYGDSYSFGVTEQTGRTDSDYGVKKEKYDLESYLLGKNIVEMGAVGNNYIDDSDTIFDASISVRQGGLGNNYVYVSFLGEIYGIEVEGEDNIVTNIEEIELEGRVGKKVKYDDKMWTILYDDTEYGLQMISDNGLTYNGNTFTLGRNDALIDWEKVEDEADLDGKDGLTDFEKTVYSYNNAITTLNTACENIVATNDNITSVRCVGSNPNNKDSENKNYYESEELENMTIDNIKGLANGVYKDEDSNCNYDWEKIAMLGLFANNEYYWLASRSGSGDFGVNIGYVMFEISTCLMRISSYDSDGFYCYDMSHYLRPVVTLNRNISFSGQGTSNDPYTFN